MLPRTSRIASGTGPWSSARSGAGSTPSGGLLAVLVGSVMSITLSLRYVDFAEKKILSVYSLRRLFPEFRDALPEMARTVALPVKVNTIAQAHRVNSGLQMTLMNKEVGFQVREVKGQLMMVDMDCEGEEIKGVVDYLKIGKF